MYSTVLPTQLSPFGMVWREQHICVVTLQVNLYYQALLHELAMYFIRKALECQMAVSEDLMFSLTFANCNFVGWVIHCVDCTVDTSLVEHALNYAESLSGEGQRTYFRFCFSVFLISSSVVCFFLHLPSLHYAYTFLSSPLTHWVTLHRETGRTVCV